ncbi:hypothetical protein CEUSTIGMA_g12561.t1 [Chlamydomonas eustigma]|uniref:mRNA (guanine-N(7))-methyltransferase n=1 Tax=Chlamydomonas eustigma TaxID=1157962 RepID=A0A250XQC7_9CHLO|nr:hypothetical protein CEUSTIGMA_g12561.t1 [Chlamydomonas eustigma]|eukprot:GAX85142.1 hypothetical protein CEUSTIGMA_g12561.t1 [Chlamydomonas eustigma]
MDFQFFLDLVCLEGEAPWLRVSTAHAEIEAILPNPTKIQFFEVIGKLKNPTVTTRLDVNVRNTRFSINDKRDISDFVSKDSLSSNANIISIHKKLIGRTMQSGFYINLKTETPFKGDKLRLIFEPGPKLYRVIKRWSVESEGLFRIDCSAVRQCNTSRPFSQLQNSEFEESYELEVEFIGDACSPSGVVESLLRGVRFLSGLQSQPLQVTTPSDNNTQILDELKLTLGLQSLTLKPVGPAPVTLLHENLLPPDVDVVSILRGYKVTAKADGLRTTIYVAGDGRVHAISKLGITNIGIGTSEGLRGTVIDCEYVQDIGYLAFDIYCASGDVSCASWNLDERLARLDKIVKDLCIDTLQVKGYLPAARGCEILRDHRLGKMKYDIDGLIFTPEDLPVGGLWSLDEPKLFGTWLNCFKWKPPSMNSIDFFVDLDSDRGIAYLYLEYRGVKTETDIDPVEYILGLDNRNKPSRSRRRLFEPLPTAQLQLDTASKTFKCSNGDVIKNGTVVEFRYDYGVFHAMRARTDKGDEANHWDVGISVFRSMTDPVTEAQVCLRDPVENNQEKWGKYSHRGDRRMLVSSEMRTFHNWVKASLIERFKGSSRLLDLACGKGGDLNHWMHAGMDYVLGLDQSSDSIVNGQDGVYARMNHDPKFSRYLFARFDASQPLNETGFVQSPDCQLLRALYGLSSSVQLPNGLHGSAKAGFPIVTCMFALHYFFEDQKKLIGFLDNVVQSIERPGGRFVGCCFDSSEVRKLLRDGVQEGRVPDGRLMWRIEDIGSERIDVYVDSINKRTPENLVDFDRLQILLQDRGLTLESTGTFEDLYKDYMGKPMDKVQQTFSFLNRCMNQRPGDDEWFCSAHKEDGKLGISYSAFMSLPKLRPLVMRSDVDIPDDSPEAWLKQEPYDTHQGAL